MLAKQLLSLHQRPMFLIAQIMKAKYFKHSYVFDAELGYRPSYIWRSLLSAQDFLSFYVVVCGGGLEMVLWLESGEISGFRHYLDFFLFHLLRLSFRWMLQLGSWLILKPINGILLLLKTALCQQ
ncbi:hypothetical protein LINGRAHAP2_LOCUS28925 [Linum grandiflorum]